MHFLRWMVAASSLTVHINEVILVEVQVLWVMDKVNLYNWNGSECLGRVRGDGSLKSYEVSTTECHEKIFCSIKCMTDSPARPGVQNLFCVSVCSSFSRWISCVSVWLLLSCDQMCKCAENALILEQFFYLI